MGKKLSKKLFKKLFADRIIGANTTTEMAVAMGMSLDPNLSDAAPVTYGAVAEGLVGVRERRRRKINRKKKGTACFKQVFDPKVGVRYERVKKDAFAHVPVSMKLTLEKPVKRAAKTVAKVKKGKNANG